LRRRGEPETRAVVNELSAIQLQLAAFGREHKPSRSVAVARFGVDNTVPPPVTAADS